MSTFFSTIHHTPEPLVKRLKKKLFLSMVIKTMSIVLELISDVNKKGGFRYRSTHTTIQLLT
jgi:hypothetical protein